MDRRHGHDGCVRRDLPLVVTAATIVALGAGCGRAPVPPAPRPETARSLAASSTAPPRPQVAPRPLDSARLLDAGTEPRAPLRYTFHPGQSQPFRVSASWTLGGSGKPKFTQRECNGVLDTLQVAADASAHQRGSFTTCRYSPIGAQPSAEQVAALSRFDGLGFEDVLSAQGELLSFRLLGNAPAELLNEAHDLLSETLVRLPAAPVGDGARWEVTIGYWQPEQATPAFGVATLLVRAGERFTLASSTADLEKSPAASAAAQPRGHGYHEVQLDPPMIRSEREAPPDAAPAPQGAAERVYVRSVRAALGGKLGAISEQDADDGMIVRDGTPGDTRGTIACGLTRCNAPHQACLFESGLGYHCATPKSGGDDAATFWCDDASDCPSGTTCCQSFASAELVYHCVARNDDCAAEMCEPGGAACPNGQVCSGLDGFCSAPPKPATCQDGRACPKAQPVCLWRGAHGRCVDDPAAQAALDVLQGGETQDAEGVHHCLLPRDCGPGEHCCTSMVLADAFTHCSINCDLTNSMQACASDSDCRIVASALCGDVRGCRVRCVRPHGDPSNTTPAWFKTCQVVE